MNELKLDWHSGGLGTLEDGCHSEILAAIRKKRWFARPATTERLTISGGLKRLPTILLVG
jgi:hypothetical protein